MVEESDIDRVARLRGKDPERYRSGQSAIENVAQRIGPKGVEACFRGSGDQRADMLLFDLLPDQSRQLLRESPLWISSHRYCDLLTACENERALVELFEACVPMFVRDRAKRAYGANHPNV